MKKREVLSANAGMLKGQCCMDDEGVEVIEYEMEFDFRREPLRGGEQDITFVGTVKDGANWPDSIRVALEALGDHIAHMIEKRGA